MLLLMPLPRRSMCFKRMQLVSYLHTGPDQTTLKLVFTASLLDVLHLKGLVWR